MSKMKSFMEWLDYRLPVTEAFNKHAGEYYAPKTLTFGTTSAYSRPSYWSTSWLPVSG